MTAQGSSPDETTAIIRRRSAFSGIEQRVLKRLQALDPRSCPRIVVGFSGGPDSLCLAAILGRLARNGHVDPRLVHVNHRLRPNDQEESRTVDGLAAQLNLPIVRRELHDRIQDAHPGVGLEEAARRERYRHLAIEAEVFGSEVIAVAHHQDDQVETVLLHLLRGSGLKGISGMGEVSRVDIPWWTEEQEPREMTIWRPLLFERKEAIDRIVFELGLTPIVDESNVDQRFRRNAIRHSLLPVIDEIFPEARTAIARFSAIAAEEDDLLDHIAEEALTRVIGGTGSLDRRALISEPVAIQRRVVRTWLRTVVSESAITLDRVEAVMQMAQVNRGGARIEVGEGAVVQIVRGELVILPGELDSANSTGNAAALPE